MRRHALSLLALLSAAGLAVAIVAIAVSSASGTPEGSVLAAPPPARGAVPSPESLPACSLARGRTPARVRVDGACSVGFRGAFECVRSPDVLALTMRRAINPRAAFYVTLVVDDYAGPGVYPESKAFAQISGRPNVPRWSGRTALVVVEPSGSVELGRTYLAPEPATPATGYLALRGQSRCSERDAALGVKPH
jgi:hypothetical protein